MSHAHPLRRIALLALAPALATALACSEPEPAAEQPDLCQTAALTLAAWVELANGLDADLEAGLSDEDAAAYGAAIAEGVADTRPLAGLLTISGASGLARLSGGLQLGLDAIEAAEDPEVALAGIDDLLEWLEAAVESCAVRASLPASEAGSITVYYEEAPGYEDLAASLAGSGVFEGISEAVSSRVALPTELEAIFTACGDANAYYSDARVVMCYEFVDLFVETFLALSDDPVEIQRQVFGVTGFFYLHELGHALVDLLAIPITGREEDSVDALAALVLLGGGSEQVLLDTVRNFAAMAALSESYGELAYWDEHSLDAQRLFDVACLVYGSDPEGWSHLVRPDLLPAQRARVCPAEFRRKSLAWDRLLEPHYR